MLEELMSSVSPGQAVAIGFFLLLTVLYIINARMDWQIRKLGQQAPRVPSYLPLGVDFIYKAMKAGSQSKDLDFWSGILDSLPFRGSSRLATFEMKFHLYARSVFTIDPENIKAVLTGQFAQYGKGERFHEEWRDFLGDSIFATDGELWSKSRALIRPMFARDRIVDTEIFEKHIAKLIPMLEGGAEGKVVDVGPLFFRFTLDAATDYLLGQSVDSLDNPKTTFAEAFQYVLHRQSVIFRSGPLSPFLSRKLFHENLKKMDDFMQPFISQVLALTPAELDHKLSKQDTFLHALARFTRDPTVLRDQLVAILLAGRDTTAATLSFCLFELSRHPTVVRKLRSEIEATCGLSTSKKPSYAELKEMKYLNAVLNETMRLYPVVPFNVRHALVDTTLPRGGGPDGLSPIGMPAGTRIVYSTMLMQRRRDLYPPPPAPSSNQEKQTAPYFDPLHFHPERWTTGNWQPKPWHFIPFNGGPRICLGQQFATIEMGYTVTRILQHYSEVRAVGGAGAGAMGVVPPPGTDPKLKFDVTLSPGEELGCLFVR